MYPASVTVDLTEGLRLLPNSRSLFSSSEGMRVVTDGLFSTITSCAAISVEGHTIFLSAYSTTFTMDCSGCFLKFSFCERTHFRVIFSLSGKIDSIEERLLTLDNLPL